MNKEMIEQAALRNAIGRFDDDDEILDVSVQSFMTGVKWGRNEVWHDASERPDMGCPVLLEYPFLGEKCYLVTEWAKYMYDNLIRWAYVKDLLPSKED